MLLILWMNIYEKEIEMPEFRGELTDDFTLNTYSPTVILNPFSHEVWSAVKYHLLCLNEPIAKLHASSLISRRQTMKLMNTEIKLLKHRDLLLPYSLFIRVF